MTTRHHEPRPTTPMAPIDLTRREVLVLISAAAAAPVVLGAPHALEAAAAEDDTATALVAGYLLGSHLLMDDSALRRLLNDPREPLVGAFRAALPEEYPLAVVPVDALGGDAGEITTDRARVWIHGLLPPPRIARGDDLRSMALTTATSPAGEGAPFTFQPWFFEAAGHTPASAPTQFVAPVSESVTVRLHCDLLRTTGPSGAQLAKSSTAAAGKVALREDRLAVTLGERAVGGAPSLRAGIYLLPLNRTSERALPLAATYDYLVPDDLLFLAYSVEPIGADDV